MAFIQHKTDNETDDKITLKHIELFSKLTRTRNIY